MPELFGSCRDRVSTRYALLTPQSHVPSFLPGWTKARSIIQISPGIGALLTQTLVTFEPGGKGEGHTEFDSLFVYVISGKVGFKAGKKKAALKAGSYVYLPPNQEYDFQAGAAGGQILLFQKAFEPLAPYSTPDLIVGHRDKISAEPFLGNRDARLQVLIPDRPEFDMAVNIFTYQPGATLPFVEIHIMEHGLMMLSGQGIYRLDSDWHPVRAGDAIWMAPYCPQWFVAMGTEPASYIYYKDVNRPPQLS